MPRSEVVIRGLGGAEALKSPPSEWTEGFPILVRELDLERYFRHLGNHTTPLDGLDIPPRAFYVFANVTVQAQAERTIDLSAAIADLVFFDNLITFIDTPSPRRVWVIRVNGRFAGLYFPELESFVLTDWTHNRSEVPHTVVPLVRELLERVGLEPLEPETGPEEFTPVEVTVGCDPEFELLEIGRDGPRVVAAYEVIDEAEGSFGPLGVDGAGSQMEVRPDPSTDPARVVESIRSIFERFALRYAAYDGSPLGERYPVGGHIHIGVGRPWRPPGQLVSMLDTFIGCPMSVLNGPARTESGYGDLSDVRTEPHGFEYRSPPAAVFAEPRMAEIVLKLARNLVSRVLNAPRGETIVYHSPPYAREYIKIGGLTREEVKYFLRFRRRWRKEKIPSLRAAWGLGEAVLSAPRLFFRDEWDFAARREYEQRLMGDETFREVAAGITVVLYGLAEDRGEVASIPIEGFDLLESPPHPVRPRPNHVVIGLPRVARVEPTWREHVDNVVTAIVRYMSEEPEDSSPSWESSPGENIVYHPGEWFIARLGDASTLLTSETPF